jgi:8-oxo-dGTP pyrophosphatase MutT (NUDIX family)
MTSYLTEAEIARRLEEARRHGPAIPQPDSPYPPEFLGSHPKHAAVLIPLLQHNGSWNVLFTRRTAILAEHSGQVAFPGGRADPNDPDPETTALREAHEEIGLKPEDVRILGRLHDFLTITNYQVAPVVGAIPWPYPIYPASVEVARVFTIPLDWLADPDNHEIVERVLPVPYQPIPVVYFKPYDNEVLWGASARFTLTFLKNLGLMP